MQTLINEPPCFIESLLALDLLAGRMRILYLFFFLYTVTKEHFLELFCLSLLPFNCFTI